MATQPVLDMKSISCRDLESYHRKTVLSEFIAIRTRDPGRRVEDVARDLNVSLSTIKRYKKSEGYESGRVRRKYTPEEKTAAAMKGKATKQRHLMYKEELRELEERVGDRSGPHRMGIDEYSSELERITNKYTMVTTGGGSANTIGPPPSRGGDSTLLHQIANKIII